MGTNSHDFFQIFSWHLPVFLIAAVVENEIDEFGKGLIIAEVLDESGSNQPDSRIPNGKAGNAPPWLTFVQEMITAEHNDHRRISNRWLSPFKKSEQAAFAFVARRNDRFENHLANQRFFIIDCRQKNL
ncbi:MAG: hypothetical protein AAF623_07195, partial [Planctomycetota bacterium]